MHHFIFADEFPTVDQQSIVTRYEEQLNKIDGTLCTIEFQREALENANTNTEVLKNMGFAAKALEGAHKQIGDIDKVCLSADFFSQGFLKHRNRC